MKQIRVTYNDAPVHCIDVCDTIGRRYVRVRPVVGGATLDLMHGAVFLSDACLAELAEALSALATRR